MAFLVELNMAKLVELLLAASLIASTSSGLVVNI